MNYEDRILFRRALDLLGDADPTEALFKSAVSEDAEPDGLVSDLTPAEADAFVREIDRQDEAHRTQLAKEAIRAADEERLEAIRRTWGLVAKSTPGEPVARTAAPAAPSPWSHPSWWTWRSRTAAGTGASGARPKVSARARLIEGGQLA